MNKKEFLSIKNIKKNNSGNIAVTCYQAKEAINMAIKCSGHIIDGVLCSPDTPIPKLTKVVLDMLREEGYIVVKNDK